MNGELERLYWINGGQGPWQTGMLYLKSIGSRVLITLVAGDREQDIAYRFIESLRVTDK